MNTACKLDDVSMMMSMMMQAIIKATSTVYLRININLKNIVHCHSEGNHAQYSIQESGLIDPGLDYLYVQGVPTRRIP